MDKVLCEQIDKKTGKTKRNNVFKTLTAAFLIGVVLLGVFMSSDVGADVFGFDAWNMIITRKDKSGSIDIEYNRNEKSVENGSDKAKKRIKEKSQYIPEGFETNKKEEDGIWLYEEWVNSNNDKYIYYSRQRILKDLIYSGKDVSGKKVDVAGYVGYIYEKKNEDKILQWNDDYYINTIYTNDDITDSEMLKISKSMYSDK